MRAYEKLMQEHKLVLADLTEDARIGIDTIKKIEKAINLSNHKGNKVSDSVLKKVEANDRWVVREILDMLEEKNTNKTEEVPHKAEEVITEIKEETPPVKVEEKKEEKKEEKPGELPVDARAQRADKEIKSLLESGKDKLTLDEMEKSAKNCYDIIFDGYKEGEENGFETTYYSVKETEPKVFALSKI